MATIKIADKEKPVQIRDLEPGETFVHRRKVLVAHETGRFHTSWVLRKTEDPYRSETLLGTSVHTFPSDLVHRAEVMANDKEENNASSS